MATPKKPAKADGQKAKNREITVLFDSRPKEFLHFNLFLVEKVGEFVHLWLGYEATGGARAKTIFYGVGYLPDLKNQQRSFQDYIEKIGGPSAEKFELRFPDPDVTPITFHSLGFARHGDAGEFVVQQVSHKMMIEMGKDESDDAPQVNGTLFGVYTSSLKIHKGLVFSVTEILR